MFTVKWVYSLGGALREHVFDAPMVDAAYLDKQCAQSGPVQLGVYDVPEGGVVVAGNKHDPQSSTAFVHGTIYVMNETGQTVSKYKLPDVGPLGELSTQSPK